MMNVLFGENLYLVVDDGLIHESRHEEDQI